MFFVIIGQCYEKQSKQHITSSYTTPQPDVAGIPIPSRQAGIITSLLRCFSIKAISSYRLLKLHFSF